MKEILEFQDVRHQRHNAPAGAGKTYSMSEFAKDAIKNKPNQFTAMCFPTKDIIKEVYNRYFKGEEFSNTVQVVTAESNIKILADTTKVLLTTHEYIRFPDYHTSPYPIGSQILARAATDQVYLMIDEYDTYFDGCCYSIPCGGQYYRSGGDSSYKLVGNDHTIGISHGITIKNSLRVKIDQNVIKIEQTPELNLLGTSPDAIELSIMKSTIDFIEAPRYKFEKGVIRDCYDNSQCFYYPIVIENKECEIDWSTASEDQKVMNECALKFLENIPSILSSPYIYRPMLRIENDYVWNKGGTNPSEILFPRLPLISCINGIDLRFLKMAFASKIRIVELSATDTNKSTDAIKEVVGSNFNYIIHNPENQTFNEPAKFIFLKDNFKFWKKVPQGEMVFHPNEEKLIYLDLLHCYLPDLQKVVVMSVKRHAEKCSVTQYGKVKLPDGSRSKILTDSNINADNLIAFYKGSVEGRGVNTYRDRSTLFVSGELYKPPFIYMAENNAEQLRKANQDELNTLVQVIGRTLRSDSKPDINKITVVYNLKGVLRAQLKSQLKATYPGYQEQTIDNNPDDDGSGLLALREVIGIIRGEPLPPLDIRKRARVGTKKMKENKRENIIESVNEKCSFNLSIKSIKDKINYYTLDVENKALVDEMLKDYQKPVKTIRI